MPIYDPYAEEEKPMGLYPSLAQFPLKQGSSKLDQKIDTTTNITQEQQQHDTPTTLSPTTPTTATNHDTCHRHLRVDDEGEWAESSAGWHNREFLESDFVILDPEYADDDMDTKPSHHDEYEDNDRKGMASPERNDWSSQRPAGHVMGVCLRVGMGPCTCEDGTLHLHRPGHKPDGATSLHSAVHDATKTKHEQKKREERVSRARMEILFGNERVSIDVARRETEKLRRSDEEVRAGGSRM